MHTQQKHTPLRKCVITKEKYPKNELIRIVRTPDGLVEIDKMGKKNGRGAYVKKDAKVIQKAKKSNILSRHLHIGIPDEIYEELVELIENESKDT